MALEAPDVLRLLLADIITCRRDLLVLAARQRSKFEG